MRNVLIGVLLVGIAGGCAPSPRYTTSRQPPPSAGGETVKKAYDKPYMVYGIEYEPMEKAPLGKTFRGMASFYGEDFHGKKTSTGEVFDMYGLTAAHKTLPLNTWVEVRNLGNKRTVIVRVNDRGPFVEGRLIDLSYGAAREIHMVENGVQEVEITILR